MAAVALVPSAATPLLARPYVPATGEASPIVRALAQVPELVPVTLPFVAQILGASAIDLRTKELVVLRVSARAACGYCIGAHTLAAAEAGVDARERAALASGDGEAAFAGRDAAAVALADAVADGGEPTEAVLDAARGWFGEHGLVELVLVAAATLMLNRFCTVLALPLGAEATARLAALAAEDAWPTSPS